MTPKKQIIKITLHFNGFFMVFSVSFYAYFVSPLGMAHLKKQFIKIIFLLIFFVFSVSYYAYFVIPPGWSVWQNKKYLFIHKFKIFILYIMFELSVIPIFVIYCPLFI